MNLLTYLLWLSLAAVPLALMFYLMKLLAKPGREIKNWLRDSGLGVVQLKGNPERSVWLSWNEVVEIEAYKVACGPRTYNACDS